MQDGDQHKKKQKPSVISGTSIYGENDTIRVTELLVTNVEQRDPGGRDLGTTSRTAKYSSSPVTVFQSLKTSALGYRKHNSTEVPTISLYF